ncbi:MAG: phosphate ABC transporter permease PstA [Pseudomonadota bacterium]
MTDISSENGIDIKVGTDRRRALHGRRYASERRFKYMGLGAVFVSVGFLVFLLYTIVGGGIPAFTYNYLNLPINLTQVDPSDPQKGDYDGAVKKGVSEAIPYLKGRKGRKLARSVISGGSGVILRNEVIDDPSMAGQSLEHGVPVSDFADLYLKGLTAVPTISTPDAGIELSATEGSVTIAVGGEVFRGFLDRIKASIGEQADRVLTRMAALQRSLDAARQTVAVSTIAEEVETAKKLIESTEAQLATFKTQYDALIQRKDSGNSSEVLDRSMPSLLLKVADGTIKVTKVDAKSAEGDVIVPLSSQAAAAGEWQMQMILDPEDNRKFSDKEVAVVDKLVEQGRIENRFNALFFTKGASREPELAGIWGAVIGSFFTMIVTLSLSFPLGVAAAIYLEEFAPKNRLTDLIEVNINNLAAVPSIVFGLLGLAVFLNFFEFPRSAPLVGGMVLALMTLPTIIIASRAALKAVPPSIREAALGIGASKLQAVFHHVLPLAMPGMLTGTIIGMAQALGETAPLLMIGMVAFVVDIPGGLTDPATVLPVQIFMWADFPEPGFQQKTAAAIMVLLAFLVAMNAVAVFLRKRFERRW